MLKNSFHFCFNKFIRVESGSILKKTRNLEFNCYQIMITKQDWSMMNKFVIKQFKTRDNKNRFWFKFQCKESSNIIQYIQMKNFKWYRDINWN